MDEKERENIVSYVQSRFEKVDLVGDLATLDLIWASEHFAHGLGYETNQEMFDMPSAKLFAISVPEIIKLAGRYISTRSLRDTQPFYKKDGSVVQVTGGVEYIVFNEHPYVVGLDGVFEDGTT